MCNLVGGDTICAIMSENIKNITEMQNILEAIAALKRPELPRDTVMAAVDIAGLLKRQVASGAITLKDEQELRSRINERLGERLLIIDYRVSLHVG